MAEVFSGIRYYPEPPSVNDIVMVKAQETEGNIGVYCNLVAYGPKMRGLLLASECSSRRVRNPLKHLSPGKFEVCVVLRVDGDQIDLSKRDIDDHDRETCTKEWTNLKRFSSIMTAVALRVNKEHNTKLTTQDLVSAFLWPVAYMGMGPNLEYSGPLEALFALVQDDSGELVHEYYPQLSAEDAPAWLVPAWEITKEITKNRFAPAKALVRAGFRLTCLGVAGVDGIKHAIRAGLKGQADVSITLVQPPEFRLSLEDDTEDAAVARARKIIKRIAAAAKQVGGEVKVPREMLPKPVPRGQQTSLQSE